MHRSVNLEKLEERLLVLKNRLHSCLLSTRILLCLSPSCAELGQMANHVGKRELKRRMLVNDYIILLN